MNIKETVGTTRQYNLHSHTHFCDGRASMKAMADAACRSGMELYAFTPHSPTSVESGCNMRYGDVATYLAEVDRLKREYRNRMAIAAGMEIDFIGVTMGPHCYYYQDLPLDVRIGSVHFVPTQRGLPVDCDGSAERFGRNLHERFKGDLRYVVEKYFEQVSTMLSLGGFDILGHFDKIAANASAILPDIEDTGWYQNIMSYILRQIIDSGVVVEVNTKAYHRSGRFFPAVRWWRPLIDAGVTLVVNSDAHEPGLITAGRAEAFEILDSMNAKV